MGLPDDYLAVLTRLGIAFVAYRTATSIDPVLVGGAATAIGTAGAFMSADFDVVAADDDAFAAAMQQAGFVSEGGIGHLANGFYLPDHPGYIVELVSGPLFDGLADQQRMVRLSLEDGVDIVMPAIEDLIADRLGQHAIASKADTSRLRQARTLLDLADDIDTAYLRRRIVEEGGNPALIGL